MDNRAKTIIITGAGSGIGRATARRFLAAGWHVGLIGRHESSLRDTAGGQASALVLPCDVTDSVAVDAAFDHAAGQWGRIDALFNNAGRGLAPSTPDLVSPEDFRAVIEVNVIGMFHCARAAFRVMRAQAPKGGRIINNGSISAHVPRPGSVTYTTTKHAITGLTRTLSLDGRPYDIACGQIDIGNAETPMVAAMNERLLAEDPQAELQQVMSVDDAARSVLHMATLPPEANVQFMTVMATKMPYIGRG